MSDSERAAALRETAERAAALRETAERELAAMGVESEQDREAALRAIQELAEATGLSLQEAARAIRLFTEALNKVDASTLRPDLGRPRGRAAQKSPYDVGGRS